MKKEITIAAAKGIQNALIITLITGLIIIFGLKYAKDIFIESNKKVKENYITKCSELSLVLNTDTKMHNGACWVEGWSRY